MATTKESVTVFLRELQPDDVDDRYLEWFREDAVTSFLVAKNLTRQLVVDYINEGRDTGLWYMYAICDEANGLHIGNLKVGNIDPAHRVSDLVTVIGDRDYWGKGVATQAVRQGTALAFDTYDLRKVSGSIAEKNVGSLNAYTRGGWVVEGTLRGAFLFGGEVQDKILVSCFNPKYFPDEADATEPD